MMVETSSVNGNDEVREKRRPSVSPEVILQIEAQEAGGF